MLVSGESVRYDFGLGRRVHPDWGESNSSKSIYQSSSPSSLRARQDPRDGVSNETPPMVEWWERNDPLCGLGGATRMFSEPRSRERSQNCLGLGDTQAWDPRVCREFQACLKVEN